MDGGRSPGRYLPVLTLLFVGSGCAALIYEIVWFQMIQLVIGATGVSLGVLLATFMGGMFAGSIALPRVVPASRHPLKVYAALEASIAVLALVLLVLVPAADRVYIGLVPRGMPSVLLRGALCGVLLVPPTVLMGATLPAIARYVEATPTGVSWMGYFYAGNIFGAVVGCLLAGFWLLRLFDVQTATLAGVGMNLSVAAVALGVSKRVGYEPPTPAADPPRSGGRAAILFAIGLSGCVALGAEVVWTRLLSLLLGTTTYTFSIILAVYLVGLGLGSGVGSALVRSTRKPERAFALAQAAALVSLVWTALALGILPGLEIPQALWLSPWKMMLVDLGRSALALLPGPVFWGASFPLAAAAVADREQDPGRLIGQVYASNTVGAIVGALGVSLVLIPTIGTQDAQRVLAGVTAVAAAVLFMRVAPRPTGLRLTLGAVLAAVLILVLPRVPDTLVADGRLTPTWDDELRIIYTGEGLNASVAVVEHPDSARSFRISGKVAASTLPEDMVLQRMLGHISALLHDGSEPETVLVVGFGAGVTAGTFVTQPGVKRIVICEIEALTTEQVGRYFTEANHGVLDDPRVEIVNDDARHFLLTTDEKFDVITSDPIHPWVKGGASLYTEEYFELARAHLQPGGVITQWVPLYESTLEAVRSEIATFTAAFPRATLWSSHRVSPGFDVVMAARPDGLVIDIEALEARLAMPAYDDVRTSLASVGIDSAEKLLQMYLGYGPDLAEWLSGAEINRDRNLRLMYLAGLGVNQLQSNDIHNEIVLYRIFPTGLIVGPPDRITVLRRTLGTEAI